MELFTARNQKHQDFKKRIPGASLMSLDLPDG
jgi:hypothetical protein